MIRRQLFAYFQGETGAWREPEAVKTWTLRCHLKQWHYKKIQKNLRQINFKFVHIWNCLHWILEISDSKNCQRWRLNQFRIRAEPPYRKDGRPPAGVPPSRVKVRIRPWSDGSDQHSLIGAKSSIWCATKMDQKWRLCRCILLNQKKWFSLLVKTHLLLIIWSTPPKQKAVGKPWNKASKKDKISMDFQKFITTELFYQVFLLRPRCYQ